MVNLPAMQRTHGVDPQVEDPTNNPPIFLPGKPADREAPSEALKRRTDRATTCSLFLCILEISLKPISPTTSLLGVETEETVAYTNNINSFHYLHYYFSVLPMGKLGPVVRAGVAVWKLTFPHCNHRVPCLCNHVTFHLPPVNSFSLPLATEPVQVRFVCQGAPLLGRCGICFPLIVMRRRAGHLGFFSWIFLGAEHKLNPAWTKRVTTVRCERQS